VLWRLWAVGIDGAVLLLCTVLVTLLRCFWFRFVPVKGERNASQMEHAYVFHDLQKSARYNQRDSADVCSEIRVAVTTRRAGKQPPISAGYKKFWQMNLAQMGSTFHQKYFNALNTTKPLTLRGLCKMLYPYSKRRKGTPTLQFSFPTKLRHMIKPQLPIYDKKVVRFFLFQEPSTKLPWEQRLNGYIVFHNFLIREYRRVIGCGQLATAIAAFHQQFHPQQHTEEKIIDWLILTFVELADKGQINW
jgi:hypothetical protein